MTNDEIQSCRKLAKKLDLCKKELLLFRSNAIINRVCNGIGPSWFPEKLRELVDKFHPSLKVAAMIHDLGYYYGDGTKEDFASHNDAFRSNGIKMSKYMYGWYDPRRYIAVHNAKKFAKLCDAFGWIAYTNAIEERKDDRNHGIK